jgi:hypothetical protein
MSQGTLFVAEALGPSGPLARPMLRSACETLIRSKRMFEMLVGGFLLTGSVCTMDGDVYGACRDIPVAQFGSKYVCDKRAETIRESFPHIQPESLGFIKGEHLKVQVKCTAAHMARI